MSHSGPIFSKPPVVRIDDGAGRFILSLEKTLAIYDSYREVAEIDIRGGIESGQWGNVFYACQGILGNGINAYLVGKGYRAQSTQLQRLRLLASAVGEDQELYQETRRLLLANPLTPNETKEHAHRCITFVEERLGMGRFRDWGSIGSKSEYVRRVSAIYGLMKAIEEMNLASMIFPTLALEKQWELRRKFVPDIDEPEHIQDKKEGMVTNDAS